MRTITLNSDYGTALMRAARDLVYPEKIGGITFTADERATFSRWFTKLWKKLKEHSPIFKASRLHVFFGPEAWYEPVKLSDDERRKTGYQLKQTFAMRPEHADVTISVQLEDVEAKAVYQLCLTWLHPESKTQLPPALQEEMVWPLVHQLGGKTVTQMEKQTGLTNAKGVEIDLGDPSPQGATVTLQESTETQK